jgi:opacity protein-like surface antigen
LRNRRPARRLARLVRLAVVAVLASSAMATRARAQVTKEPEAAIFPDPKKFAHGLFTEGEVGAVAFFGPAGESVAPGFAIGARVGYDVFRFFALQIHGLGSTHLTKAGDRPEADQLIQTYQGTVEGKLTLRFGQLSIFGEGGVGVTRLSTNLLYTLGVEQQYRTGLTAGGGGGIDYHSLSRHFSIGLRGEYYWLRDLRASKDLIVTTYLRYTF